MREYVATWELQERGVLHINLIASPWQYVPVKDLQKAWWRYGGGWLSVDRIRCGAIGNEVAKVGTLSGAEGLADYLSKFDQAVKTGKGVTYSQGWPKLPAPPGRRGVVKWAPAEGDTWEVFKSEQDRGFWLVVRPGEWRDWRGEECDCFDFALPDPVPDPVPR